MATKEDKYNALNLAHKVAKKYAEGGAGTTTPHIILRDYYHMYLELLDEIEKGD